MKKMKLLNQLKMLLKKVCSNLIRRDKLMKITLKKYKILKKKMLLNNKKLINLEKKTFN